jgi:hypothetical protein
MAPKSRGRGVQRDWKGGELVEKTAVCDRDDKEVHMFEAPYEYQ